jgi:tRNA pseudouridine65 synthase
VAKPAGLFVHRTRLDGGAQRPCLQRLRDQLGVHLYPVHRIDRATSGLLLFALDRDSARSLSAAFAAGAVGKRYLAIVRGHAPPALAIDHPLRRLAPAASGHADPPAQPARTSLRRLATAELDVCVDRYPTSRYSLVELAPQTGRRHQLRRHLKHAGYPIVGDTTYGQGRHNRLLRERFDCHRLLLAAVELSLAHPSSGAPLRLVAPLDRDFAGVVAALGFSESLPARWRAPPAPTHDR